MINWCRGLPVDWNMNRNTESEMTKKNRGKKLLSLNKQRFLESRVCLTRGWFLRREAETKLESLSDAEIFLIEQGMRVGELARRRYPEGVLVESGAGNSAEEQTREFLADKNVKQIFEATFRSEEIIARADILERVAGGWHVIEVKSSRFPVRSKSKLSELLDDLAFTVMVVQKAGLRVKRASLALISPDFRLGMELSSLFVEQDHTTEVRARVRAFKRALPDIANGTVRASLPKPELIPACNTCEFFATRCLGQGVVHPVTELPRIGKKISTLGTVAIGELAKDTRLTPSQKIVAQSVWKNTPQVKPSLKAALEGVQWPAYYLDFEATATALPLYPDIAPYEIIPTQYSIHRCSAPGRIEWHREYLADPMSDCREALARQLLGDLGRKGSVVVYTSYEKRIITALMGLFPKLAAQLEALLPRLFDLEKAINGAYYHPEFRGSYSIKRVLPVLVEGPGYKEQVIQSGNEAAAAFARLALGEYGERKTKHVKNDLLKYCKQDTKAMVDLHEALKNLS